MSNSIEKSSAGSFSKHLCSQFNTGTLPLILCAYSYCENSLLPNLVSCAKNLDPEASPIATAAKVKAYLSTDSIVFKKHIAEEIKKTSPKLQALQIEEIMKSGPLAMTAFQLKTVLPQNVCGVLNSSRQMGVSVSNSNMGQEKQLHLLNQAEKAMLEGKTKFSLICLLKECWENTTGQNLNVFQVFQTTGIQPKVIEKYCTSTFSKRFEDSYFLQAGLNTLDKSAQKISLSDSDAFRGEFFKLIVLIRSLISIDFNLFQSTETSNKDPLDSSEIDSTIDNVLIAGDKSQDLKKIMKKMASDPSYSPPDDKVVDLVNEMTLSMPCHQVNKKKMQKHLQEGKAIQEQIKGWEETLVKELNMSKSELLIHLLFELGLTEETNYYELLRKSHNSWSEKEQKRLLNEEEKMRSKKEGRPSREASRTAHTKRSLKMPSHMGFAASSEDLENQREISFLPKKQTIDLYKSSLGETREESTVPLLSSKGKDSLQSPLREKGWKTVPFRVQGSPVSRGLLDLNSLKRAENIGLFSRVSRWIEVSSAKVREFPDQSSSGELRYKGKSQEDLVDQIIRHNPVPVLKLLTEKDFIKNYLKPTPKGFLALVELESSEKPLPSKTFATVGLTSDKSSLYHFFVHPEDERANIDPKAKLLNQLFSPPPTTEGLPSISQRNNPQCFSGTVSYLLINSAIKVAYSISHPEFERKAINCSLTFFPTLK